MITKNYVVFYSPGTFFAESTSKEIDSWDTEKAIALSKEITERYGARPYGFRFKTLERDENDASMFPQTKETKTSGMYFLGGTIYTLEQIKARNDPNDRILIRNMESNGVNRVVENTNSYKTTRLFEDGDTFIKI